MTIVPGAQKTVLSKRNKKDQETNKQKKPID